MKGLTSAHDINTVLRAVAKVEGKRRLGPLDENASAFECVEQRVQHAWMHFDALTEQRERARKMACEAEYELLAAAREVL
jgi:hypothetical protein